MPKELARVMAQYGDIQKKVNPLLSELKTHEHDYIIMRDAAAVTADDLADQLKAMRIPNAADPRAAQDPEISDLLERLEKYTALMDSRATYYKSVAAKGDDIRTELLKLEKDVLAVIKAKSGFFSRSKSLPQLKALSASLHQLAEDLRAATTLV